MQRFIKYFLLAFFGQIPLIVLLVLLLEVTGVLLFWWLLLYLYVFPAIAIGNFFLGTVQERGDLANLLTTAVPMSVYALLFSAGLVGWKKLRQSELDSI